MELMMTVREVLEMLVFVTGGLGMLTVCQI